MIRSLASSRSSNSTLTSTSSSSSSSCSGAARVDSNSLWKVSSSFPMRTPCRSLCIWPSWELRLSFTSSSTIEGWDTTRHTWTARFWGSLWARSMTCSSLPGAQNGSVIIKWEASTRIRPTSPPPKVALVHWCRYPAGRWWGQTHICLTSLISRAASNDVEDLPRPTASQGIPWRNVEFAIILSRSLPINWCSSGIVCNGHRALAFIFVSVNRSYHNNC